MNRSGGRRRSALDLHRVGNAIARLCGGHYKYAVAGIERTLGNAATLRDEIKRHREESVALRVMMRREMGKRRVLIWQARNYRATATYSRLLARVRAGAPSVPAEPPDADHLLAENRRLSDRIRNLETRISNLAEDRDAFFEAFGRYLKIERLFVK